MEESSSPHLWDHIVRGNMTVCGLPVPETGWTHRGKHNAGGITSWYLSRDRFDCPGCYDLWINQKVRTVPKISDYEVMHDE